MRQGRPAIGIVFCVECLSGDTQPRQRGEAPREEHIDRGASARALHSRLRFTVRCHKGMGRQDVWSTWSTGTLTFVDIMNMICY